MDKLLFSLEQHCTQRAVIYLFLHYIWHSTESRSTRWKALYQSRRVVFSHYYSFLARDVAQYCDEYVCLSVRSHNSNTTRPTFTQIFAHVAYSCGSVLLRRRCSTLCTSGFAGVQWSIYGRSFVVTIINLQHCMLHTAGRSLLSTVLCWPTTVYIFHRFMFLSQY